MGREIRRVPFDFDWPIGATWHGYLLPERLHETLCDACSHLGSTPARLWVEQITRLLLLLDDDLNAQRRGQPMHPYLDHTGYIGRGRPSPDIAEFGTGLAERSGDFLGHDSIDAWRATTKIIQAAGLDPDVWGICATCRGHGSTEAYPGQRAEAEAWESTDPPSGDAWQVWQTVSEGAPISPVFAAREDLVDWLCSPAYQFGISRPMQREQAERFVDAGWAPSMVGVPGVGVVSGEQWIGGAS